MTTPPPSSSPPPSFTPQSRQPQRKPRHLRIPSHGRILPRTRSSILIVTLASGLLFGLSAANARHTDESSGELVDLVRDRNAKVETLDIQMSGLKSQIEQLVEKEVAGSGEKARQHRDLAYVPMVGPGVTITLTDAPPGPIPENATVNDLVIHQQDIENVMNALWAGEAEAMSVQGQRITNRSIIRCIGNVIFVDGVSYSPPYVISAIGDPERLSAVVENDRAIQNYQAHVVAYGLGWKLETNDELHMPAAQTDPAVQHAHMMEKNG